MYSFSSIPSNTQPSGSLMRGIHQPMNIYAQTYNSVPYELNFTEKDLLEWKDYYNRDFKEIPKEVPYDEKTYAIIHYKDVKTGRVSQRNYPDLLRSVKENIEMYKRYLAKDLIEFSIEILEGTYDEIKKKYKNYLIRNVYEPCCFNMAVNGRGKYSHTIIPKDQDDSRDMALRISKNNLSQEKEWVIHCIFDQSICENFYRQYVDDLSSDYKIYGSCCHRGYVNNLFDFTHTPSMRRYRGWIELLGENGNIEKLKDIKFDYDDSIDKICEYCHTMFGYDKDEIKKLCKIDN